MRAVPSVRRPTHEEGQAQPVPKESPPACCCRWQAMGELLESQRQPGVAHAGNQP